MGAHEPTVHCTKKQNFFGFHVHVCVCACVVDLTYVRCLHMFGCLSHCVMRESFFFEGQTLRCHVCRPDAGRIF